MQDKWSKCSFDSREAEQGGEKCSSLGEHGTCSPPHLHTPVQSVRATLPQALNMFEGAQLTQLVQLVTAGRLFLVCEGQEDPLWINASTTNISVGHDEILIPSKLVLSHSYNLEWKEIRTMLRLLKMRLNLSLGTLSAEGQGYPKVTKLRSPATPA